MVNKRCPTAQGRVEQPLSLLLGVRVVRAPTGLGAIALCDPRKARYTGEHGACILVGWHLLMTFAQWRLLLGEGQFLEVRVFDFDFCNLNV